MRDLKKTILASTLSVVISGSAIATLLQVSGRAQSFDGDFDKNESKYSVWDGESYDFSWYEPGKDTYTISTAAQFAALSIITNDISGDEYEAIRDNLTEADTGYNSEYIGLSDDFSNATITLESDIDLGSFDFLPICYPWKTANLSSTYEITRPDGTTTHYIALEDVPDITPVDSWVGDENGDMISTRYWEFPESEARFRDLLYAVNFEGEVNQRVEQEASIDDTFWCVNTIDHTSGLPAGLGVYGGTAWRIKLVARNAREAAEYSNTLPMIHYQLPTNEYEYTHLVRPDNVIYSQDDVPGTGWHLGQYDHMDILLTKPTGASFLASNIIGLDEDHMVAPYYYKDIKEYTETNGFSGTFEGNNHRIKGLVPTTPWTEDPMKRLYTYDPMSKGLFGMIGEEGRLLNLNVQGAYGLDDTASYSGILCGYNYGIIDNCWIDGDMELGTITQYYPIRRDYEFKNSEYVLSENPGTILPAGHTGFVTGVNNGVISNCTTSGEVRQAFRAFGFAACTNNGTIENFVNKASFSSYDITTDFTTDEWTYNTNYEHKFDLSAWDTYFHYNITTVNWTGYRDIFPFYVATHSTFSNPNSLSAGEVIQYSAAYRTLISETGLPWVPPLYNTGDYESIAANHIYGVYGYTAVGGVCAENNGIIRNADNKGEIKSMANTSTRLEGPAYDYTVVNAEKQDFYSYIRPYSSYGLFSTQSNVVILAAGIVPYNTGKIYNSSNSGNIIAIDKDETSSYDFNGRISMIPYTGNGYYMYDCAVYDNTYKEAGDGPSIYMPYDESDYLYYPLGFLYWMSASKSTADSDYEKPEVSEPSDEDLAEAGINPDDLSDEDIEILERTDDSEMYTYDETKDNMPYPMTFGDDILTRYTWSYQNEYCAAARQLGYAYTAGISVWNTGIIDTVENSGSAMSNIILASDINSYLNNDITPFICNVNANNADGIGLALILCDTDIENIYVNESNAKEYSSVGYVLAESRNVTNKNISVYSGPGLYFAAHGDENHKILVDNVYIYDSSTDGWGCSAIADYVTYSNIYNFQNSVAGTSWNLNNCNLENIYMYGDASSAGIGSGTIDEYITNANFYGSAETGYAVGSLSGGEYNDIHVASYKSDGTLDYAKEVADISNATVKNLDSFCNIMYRGITLSSCDVDGISIVGSTLTATPTEDNNNGASIEGDTYWYFVDNSNCKNMLFQLDIPFEWENPFEQWSKQNVPGVLKVYGDSNTFENVVIQTPNGAVSYPTYNFMLSDDTSIKSDAYLSYDENSHKSGAMAYYMDHGNMDNRTYNYTVARNDTEDILAKVSDYVEMDRVDSELVNRRTVNYPEYTRKIVDPETEKPYYRFNIPFTGNGAGELIGSIEHDGVTYQTKAEDEIFPVIDLFAQEGESIDFDLVEHEGYTLKDIVRASKSGTESLGYKKPTSEIMPAEDVSYICEWTGVHKVEVDDSNDYVDITANCEYSALGRRVYVNTLLSSDDVTLDSVFYYNYILDSSNRLVLDYGNPVYIDQTLMYFEMPDNDIIISARTLNNKTGIDEFILGGTLGMINSKTHTITVNLDASVDITNIAPDRFTVTEGVTINPLPTVMQDFTEPVQYTLTAEGGREDVYTVVVNALADGMITRFEVLGRSGIIDQEQGVIALSMSNTIDLTSITPYIVWNGAFITPEGAVNLEDEDLTYTVISSSGVSKVYSIELTRTEGSGLQGFDISIPGLNDIIWTRNDTNMTISCVVPYGTILDECIITELSWNGVTANFEAGDEINLTKANYLTIANDDGTSSTYSIVALEDPSTIKEISQFRLYGHDGIIDQTAKIITVTVPTKYDITSIMPDVVCFTGYRIQENIYERKDYSNSVVFTVEAYDGSTTTYTINVIQAD